MGFEGTLETDGARIDDWHPPELGIAAVLQIQAGDNHGNEITGIDAVGARISVGTRITICNTNAAQDDGIVAFAPEDPHSQPNNRVWTPGYGRDNGQVATDRFTIGPSECVDAIYMQPNQSDPANDRWIFVGPATRVAQTTVKQLGLFPSAFPPPLADIVDDWDADDTCPMVSGPMSGMCEGGSNPAFTSYSVVFASTVDGDGATITGMRYTGSQHAEGQGPVKIVFNLGPGSLRLVNRSPRSDAHNQFLIRAAGSEADIVLAPSVGQMFYHLRDTGGWIPMSHGDYLFDARDVTMKKGLVVAGTSETSSIPNTTLTVDNQDPWRTAPNYQSQYIRDVGAYDTTRGNIIATGLVIAADAIRAVGASPLTNVALHLDASGAQQNMALITDGGDVYFGRGSQMHMFYANTALFDVSGDATIESRLTLGGGDFSDLTHAITADAGHVPTVDHGSLTSDSTNYVGRIETVGDFTHVRLTFGGSGFTATSHCLTQVITPSSHWHWTGNLILVTPSASAPLFTCIASHNGQPANCPDFEYQCWGH